MHDNTQPKRPRDFSYGVLLFTKYKPPTKFFEYFPSLKHKKMCQQAAISFNKNNKNVNHDIIIYLTRLLACLFVIALS